MGTYLCLPLLSGELELPHLFLTQLISRFFFFKNVFHPFLHAANNVVFLVMFDFLLCLLQLKIDIGFKVSWTR